MDNKEEAIKVLDLYGDCSGAKIMCNRLAGSNNQI